MEAAGRRVDDARLVEMLDLAESDVELSRINRTPKRVQQYSKDLLLALQELQRLRSVSPEPSGDFAELRQLVKDVCLAEWKEDINAYRAWVCRAVKVLDRTADSPETKGEKHGS